MSWEMQVTRKVYDAEWLRSVTQNAVGVIEIVPCRGPRRNAAHFPLHPHPIGQRQENPRWRHVTP